DINQKFKHHWLYGDFDMNLTENKQSFENSRDNNTTNSTNQLVGMRYSGSLGPLGEVEFGYGNHNLKEVQSLNNLSGMILRNLDHNARKVETRKYIDLNRFEWMIGVQMENSVLKFWDDRNLTNVNQVGLKGATLNRDQVGVATVIKLHSKGDDDGRWLTDLDVSYRQDRVTDYKSDLVYRNDHISSTENLAFMKFGDNSWQNNIFKLSTIASKRSPGQTLAFWVTTGNNIKFPTLQQQISLTDIPVGQQRALIPEKMKSLEIGVNIVKQPKEVPNIDQIEFQGSLFRNDYSDKMRVTYLLGMPVGFYENIGHANMMGIEGKIKMKAYGGRVFGDMAFSKYDVSDLSAFPFKSTFTVTASMTAKWKYFSIGSRWFQEGEQVGMIHVPDKGFNEIELPSFSNYDIYWTLKVNIGPL
ncbi:MAG: TonB-dependent receptor, partial [bacterium]